MAALGELAQLIRSKNAGPWNLTVDVMFPDARTYNAVVASGVITPELITTLLGTPAEKVRIFPYAPANAIKVTVPRNLPNGHPRDTDVFGGQQFAALVDLEVPGVSPS